MAERRSSDQRRKEILETSLEIIYNRGFYRLTIRNIADDIDVSEAAVYRHFKNKKEIIAKLADKFFCHDKKIESISPEDNTIAKLRKIMEKQFEIFSKNPLLTVITFQEEIFREYPEIWEKFNKHREKREEMLKNIIVRGKKKDEIAQNIDPEAFTLLFMGAIRISVIRWRSSDFSFSIIDEGKKVFQELLKLIKPD